MGKKLAVLFDEWVASARERPTEGHRARLANGATLMFFPASQKMEVWRDGEMPVVGQSSYGLFIFECSTFERYATDAGLTLSNRRMQMGAGKFCARWDCAITMGRLT